MRIASCKFRGLLTYLENVTSPRTLSVVIIQGFRDADAAFYLDEIQLNLELLQAHQQAEKDSLVRRSVDSAYSLGLLAAIFLPLQLSATVLSMDTRFKHLHGLLADLMTLSFLLLIVVLLVYRLTSMVMRPSITNSNDLAWIRKLRHWYRNADERLDWPIAWCALFLLVLAVVICLTALFRGWSDSATKVEVVADAIICLFASLAASVFYPIATSISRGPRSTRAETRSSTVPTHTT